MSRVHSTEGDTSSCRSQSGVRFLRRAAVRFGAGARRDVERGARRRYGNRLMATVQIRDARQRPGALTIGRIDSRHRSEDAKTPRSCHHLGTAARRERSGARTLRPVRTARFSTHYSSTQDESIITITTSLTELRDIREVSISRRNVRHFYPNPDCRTHKHNALALLTATMATLLTGRHFTNVTVSIAGTHLRHPGLSTRTVNSHLDNHHHDHQPRR